MSEETNTNEPELNVPNPENASGEGEQNNEGSDDRTAAPWVKDLRKRQAQLAKENRQLKEELYNLKKPQQSNELGPKPTLESCQFDSDVLADELEKWVSKKVELDAQAARQQAQQNAAVEAWNKKQNDYFAIKKEFVKEASDFENAEQNVIDILPEALRSDLIDLADNAVEVVYQIGNDIDLLEKLAGMNRTQFAHALGKLGGGKRTASRAQGPAPRPEQMAAKGGTPKTVNATLAQLRAEAERTGNYSKVIEYKRLNKTK